MLVVWLESEQVVCILARLSVFSEAVVSDGEVVETLTNSLRPPTGRLFTCVNGGGERVQHAYPLAI